MKKPIIIFVSVLVIAMQGINGGCNNKKTSAEKARSSTNAGPDTATDFVLTTDDKPVQDLANFVEASRLVMPAVVHIRVRINIPATYGNAGGAGMASGSGVIVTGNGYIATNNHVVEQASEINVTLPDRRSFPARVVGRDANTDLALLKIEVDSLPSIHLLLLRPR
jgi:S1-C subfamily serine protease